MKDIIICVEFDNAVGKKLVGREELPWLIKQYQEYILDGRVTSVHFDVFITGTTTMNDVDILVNFHRVLFIRPDVVTCKNIHFNV